MPYSAVQSASTIWPLDSTVDLLCSLYIFLASDEPLSILECSHLHPVPLSSTILNSIYLLSLVDCIGRDRWNPDTDKHAYPTDSLTLPLFLRLSFFLYSTTWNTALYRIALHCILLTCRCLYGYRSGRSCLLRCTWPSGPFPSMTSMCLLTSTRQSWSGSRIRARCSWCRPRHPALTRRPIKIDQMTLSDFSQVGDTPMEFLSSWFTDQMLSFEHSILLLYAPFLFSLSRLHIFTIVLSLTVFFLFLCSFLL